MAKRAKGKREPPAEAFGFTKPERREARIDLRVTPEELGEMKATAKSLGLTMSEYIRQCHRIAIEALRKGGGGNG